MSDRVPTLTSSEVQARLQAFEREHLRGKSRETAGTYRRSLNRLERFVAEQEGGLRLDPAGIERYKGYLEESGLSPVSISTYLTAVRQFCSYLVEVGFLASNPARTVKGNARPQEHSRRVLTVEEVQVLETVLDRGSVLGLRDRAMVYCMLYAGLSEIEIIRADVCDLEQTLLGWVLRVQGKGRRRKDQHLPVDEPVVEAVREYLRARGPVRQEEPLFVSHGPRAAGDRLNTRSVRSRIHDLLDASGLKESHGSKGPKVTPHSLTHTAPVLWLNAGMSLDEVRRRMRHGTPETTLIYQRHREALDEQDADDDQ